MSTNRYNSLNINGFIVALCLMPGATILGCSFSTSPSSNQSIYVMPGDDDDSPSAPDGDDDEEEGEGDDTPSELCEGAGDTSTTLAIYTHDSNSLANPVHARDRIHLGYPVHAQMELNEFLHYYDFDLPEPDAGTLGIYPQLEASGDSDSSYTLFIGVIAPTLTAEERPLFNLTIVVDNSLSMAGRGIELTQTALRTLAGELKAGDRISLVGANEDAQLLLDTLEVDGPDSESFLDAVDALVSAGSSELGMALEEAYAVAELAYEPDRVNQVLVFSDGGDMLTVMDEQQIAAYAAPEAEVRIALSGIGVTSEPDVYNDDAMYLLTGLGGGSYRYIDSMAEAEKQFSGEALLEGLVLFGEDIHVQVTLPTGLQYDAGADFSEEIPIEEVDPQSINFCAHAIFHADLTGCALSAFSGQELLTFTVFWRNPATRIEEQTTLTLTLDELLGRGDDRAKKMHALRLYGLALAPSSQWDADMLLFLLGCWTCLTDDDLTVPERAYEKIEEIQAQLSDADLSEVLDLLATYIGYAE